MKRIFCLGAFVLSLNAIAQVDTLKVNKDKYVRIDLKAPVESYHISNPNDFYIESKGNNLFIQALDEYANESNLFVSTKNNSYDYFVAYTEKIEKYVYEVEQGKSENAIQLVNNKIELTNPINPKKDSFIRNRNLMTKNGISLYIKGIFIKNENLYFLFEIANRSGISFNVKSIDFYVVQPKELRSKSLTEEIINPEFVYEDFDNLQVPSRKNQYVTMVFKKFTLNERDLIVRLTERNGERNIELPIKNELLIKTKEIR